MANLKLALAGFLLLASGCGVRTAECPKESDLAVMRKLNPILAFKPCASVECVDGYKARIAEIREWSQRLDDPCYRAGYEHWLNYWEREFDERYEGILADRKLTEYEGKHPVPMPPPAEGGAR